MNYEAVAGLVAAIRGTIGTLPQNSQATVASDLDTIEAQLRRPEPKGSIIRECLRSARTILEAAGATLLANEIGRFLGLRTF
jgi:hypothetical protein